MSARTPFMAANWKMHKTVAEAEAFVQALLPRVSTADGVDVAICAPFTALAALVDSTRGSRVRIYAQTMHQAAEGAFTGEISAAMLTELDVHGVLLGHSERRQYFAETDRALAEKVAKDRLPEVVIAYEPIWAIGTGKVATPEIAQDAIGFVRALVGDRSKEAAERVRILYGGSVKPDNAAEILAQPDVDGALVGGASLDPEGFAEIAAAAA